MNSTFALVVVIASILVGQADLSARGYNDTAFKELVWRYERVGMVGAERPTKQVTNTNVTSKGKFQIDGFGQEFKVSYRRAPDVASLFTADANITVLGGGGGGGGGGGAADRKRGTAQRQQLPVSEVIGNFVVGRVLGDSGSNVFGLLRPDGVFEGHITTALDTYYVERAFRFFGHEADKSDMIMYRERDIRFDVGTSCPDPMLVMNIPQHQQVSNATQADSNITNNEESETCERVVRSYSGNELSSMKGKECRLQVVIDQWFSGDLFGGDTMAAFEEAVYHLVTADGIFRATDFDGDGLADNIGIRIAGMDIIGPEQQEPPLPRDTPGDRPVLHFFAETYNFDHVCLGFLFTYRSFGDGGGHTLGTAFRAHPDDRPGGICERRQPFAPWNLDMSLNSAMVTLKAGNTDGPRAALPRGRSLVSVAHELGHSFGSPHDNEDIVVRENDPCRPTNPADRFLMFAGKEIYTNVTDTNRKFSPCSIRAIREVLPVKGHCFTDNEIIQGVSCDCVSTTPAA